jgi:pimeloyl-ACP methyl ester carboxylesterase
VFWVSATQYSGDVTPSTFVVRRSGVVDRRNHSTTTIDLTVQTDGDPNDPPLLMVMGLGAQMYLWPDALVHQLVDAGFFVLRFDNRDVGLSSKTTGRAPEIGDIARLQLSRGRIGFKPPYLLTDMAEDAFAVLDHVGIERAHIVGASMGGMIVQSMAIHSPHRILSLTSIMSNTGDRKNGVATSRFLLQLGRLSGGAANRDDAVERAIEVARLTAGSYFDPMEARSTFTRLVDRSYAPEAVRFQLAAIGCSPDRTPSLRALRLPSLVVHGALDRLVPISGGRATAAALQGSRYVVFDDMGHDLPKHRWPELVEAIKLVAGRGDHRLRSVPVGAGHKMA